MMDSDWREGEPKENMFPRRRWAREKMCSQGKDGTEDRMWPRGEDGLGEGSLRRKWVG
jgi:hypothetical protein